MKTILIINIIGLIIALIGITIFFALWLKAERRIADMERKNVLIKKQLTWIYGHAMFKVDSDDIES